jgi:hypothetical protein
VGVENAGYCTAKGSVMKLKKSLPQRTCENVRSFGKEKCIGNVVLRAKSPVDRIIYIQLWLREMMGGKNRYGLPEEGSRDCGANADLSVEQVTPSEHFMTGQLVRALYDSTEFCQTASCIGKSEHLRFHPISVHDVGYCRADSPVHHR